MQIPPRPWQGDNFPKYLPRYLLKRIGEPFCHSTPTSAPKQTPQHQSQISSKITLPIFQVSVYKTCERKSYWTRLIFEIDLFFFFCCPFRSQLHIQFGQIPYHHIILDPNKTSENLWTILRLCCFSYLIQIWRLYFFGLCGVDICLLRCFQLPCDWRLRSSAHIVLQKLEKN